jgi:hypothetical protein
MVTTIEVTYPKGRMPTSVSTIPAKIIKIHALTKNNGPAARSLKNAPMTTSIELLARRQLDAMSLPAVPGSAIRRGHDIERHL